MLGENRFSIFGFPVSYILILLFTSRDPDELSIRTIQSAENVYDLHYIPDAS